MFTLFTFWPASVDTVNIEVDVVHTAAHPPGVSAKSYHHGQLRSALIDKALDALERDGELPSWRALARACNVSQSAPYRHFASLDELRIAVIAEGFRRLTAKLREAIAMHTDPLTRLDAGCTTYMRYGIEHPALYGLMFSGSGDLRDGEAGRAGTECYQTLVDCLASCGVRDPHSAAFVVWTAEHGLVDIVRSGVRAPGMPRTTEALLAASLAMQRSYVERVLADQGSRTTPRELARPRKRS